jgi:hypothetical protein
MRLQPQFNLNQQGKVIDGRYCKGSTILKTNTGFEALGAWRLAATWDPMITAATVDRRSTTPPSSTSKGLPERLKESKPASSQIPSYLNKRDCLTSVKLKSPRAGLATILPFTLFLPAQTAVRLILQFRGMGNNSQYLISLRCFASPARSQV